MKHHYTDQQKKFITKNIKGRLVADLTEKFNRVFGTDLSCNQIRAFIKNNRLKSGVQSQFQQGHIPNNKGKKGIHFGGKATQFKKGRLPHNYMPVGSERINGYGYIDIKIADPNKWRAKHLIIWEEHNKQSIPPGSVVLFSDQNKLNLDPNNLILISRGQLGIMNKRHLCSKDTEITRTGTIIAKLIEKIGQTNSNTK
ncbi:HNH endonuclease [Paenibacillus sp. CFBP13512]|uniref:HNH endonuclease n=1 Tax=Paenibacillus sp. CFBP13512 TaxID=2184007 RepID=UPI0010C081DB|nr:HNH endonuclease [Paenibacillus sp. CFBP13512]TKJ83767.1 HNH endonuclease [Paenibacillus sp. CFBP13512]